MVINEDYVDFRACGTGGRGKNIYEFHIEFYLPIDPKVLVYLSLLDFFFIFLTLFNQPIFPNLLQIRSAKAMK